MKNLFAILLVLTPCGALADGYICSEAPGGSSHRAIVSRHNHSAIIERQENGRYVHLGVVECVPQHRSDDGNTPHDILLCFEYDDTDAGTGLLLTVSSGGVAGVTAVLSRRAPDGPRTIANLICRPQSPQE